MRILCSLPNAAIYLCVSLYFKAESVWTHFDNLDPAEFPTPEELFRAALSLYDNYSTPLAGTIFMLGCKPNSPIVSIGEPWREEEDAEPKLAPAGVDDVDDEQVEKEDGSGEEEGKEGPKEWKDAVPVEKEEFNGDCMLTKSALLMYEALVSKEVAQAVAEGDVGRIYEGIKVSHWSGPNLSVLTGYSSCYSRLRGPRITSTPVTCSTRLPSWKLMPGQSYGICSYKIGWSTYQEKQAATSRRI